MFLQITLLCRTSFFVQVACKWLTFHEWFGFSRIPIEFLTLRRIMDMFVGVKIRFTPGRSSQCVMSPCPDVWGPDPGFCQLPVPWCWWGSTALAIVTALSSLSLEH